MIFVTGRIILIPFPDELNTQRIAGYLNTMYNSRYMVWNLSEHLYRSDMFNGQVLDFVFVGYPNPPLSEIFSIFNSVSAWLESDTDNVAVIHCQQTKARSYMIISAYLAWQNLKNPLNIFQQIGGPQVTKLFPSQYRYLQYIHKVIQGVRVRSSQPTIRTLCIKKVIISGLRSQPKQFSPYLQFFKDGKSIFSTLKEGVPQLTLTSESILSFDVNLQVSGDFIIRCREICGNKSLTIFRTMVHSAFCDEFSIRFFRNDLDSVQEKLNDEFWVDVFYTSEEGEDQVVPGNLKSCAGRKKEEREERKVGKNGKGSESESEEEEKIDRELLEKFKAAVDGNESSSLEEDEDFDDYFQKLEMGK